MRALTKLEIADHKLRNAEQSLVSLVFFLKRLEPHVPEEWRGEVRKYIDLCD
jgi:hypothetical protein